MFDYSRIIFISVPWIKRKTPHAGRGEETLESSIIEIGIL